MHRGNGPCTGRSGRLRPPLGSCAASGRGSVCGPTWRSRGRRRAERAVRRLPSTADTALPSSPPRHACVERVCAEPCQLERHQHGAFQASYPSWGKSKARVPPRVAGCRRDGGEAVARCVLRACLATTANGDSAPHGSRLTSVWTSRGLCPRARRGAPRRRRSVSVGTLPLQQARGACRLRRSEAPPSYQAAAGPRAARLPKRVHRC